jgi:hypothetical protein
VVGSELTIEATDNVAADASAPIEEAQTEASEINDPAAEVHWAYRQNTEKQATE